MSDHGLDLVEGLKVFGVGAPDALELFFMYAYARNVPSYCYHIECSTVDINVSVCIS